MAYENEKIEESMFEYECELDKALTYYSNELALVKAGRANPKILDKIMIDYYDTPTPINQIAGISVPEARMIVISPWDHTQIKPIVKAIQTSDIGITPMDDGKVIRLVFPALTEERRREIAKSTHKLAEDVLALFRCNNIFLQMQADEAVLTARRIFEVLRGNRE